ncbi:MAG: YCF48-related protein [Cyclobacteriaceae bacterium]
MNKLLLILLSIFVSFSSMAQWTKTNGPVGAAAYDLVKLGNYLFINGGPGGIFRSEDNGLNWKAVNKGLPYYPHCYSFTKSGSNIYASIVGAGVYYSSDLGENWIAINKSIESLTIYSLFVNGNDIYAGSSQGGFYYSSNHGVTWSFIEGVFKGKQIRDFVICGSKLFAASDGIYTSEDKGLTWTKLVLGITSVNAISAVDNTLYVSGGQPLHISRDFGVTWTTSNIGTSGGAYFMSAIYATGDEVYIGASSGAIFYSNDEGKNWSTYLNSTIDNTHNKILKVNEFLFLATNEGVYRSTDNATNWQSINNGLVNHVIRQIGIDGTSILVGTSFGLHSSSDNGQSWMKQIIGTKILGFNQVDAIYIGNNYILVGTSAGIFKSIDHGQTWSKKLSLAANKTVNTLSSGNSIKLTALVNGEGMYASVDGGENWVLKPALALKDANFTASFSKGDTLVIGAIENVFISKDFGNNWEARKVIPTYFYPNSIRYFNSKLIVSTYQGIFQSIDFGNTWSRIGDFPSGTTFNDFTINSSGFFYSATNQGVYVSYNSGTNWYPVNEGLDHSDSYALSFTSEFIFCGTYGMGVWRRPLDNLNVRPKIKGLKKDLVITENQSINLTASDFEILDPDNNYPQDFTLKVKSGANYALSGTGITPSLNFNGDLSVSVKVNDGHSDSDEYTAIVKVVVGVNETTTESFLYPNPAGNILHTTDKSSNKSIIIFDYLGKEILRSNPSGAYFDEYDISELKVGMYLVKIEGSRKFQKIIKN